MNAKSKFSKSDQWSHLLKNVALRYAKTSKAIAHCEKWTRLHNWHIFSEHVRRRAVGRSTCQSLIYCDLLLLSRHKRGKPALPAKKIIQQLNSYLSTGSSFPQRFFLTNPTFKHRLSSFDSLHGMNETACLRSNKSVNKRSDSFSSTCSVPNS